MLNTRKLKKGIIDEFELGFAPDEWDGLLTYMNNVQGIPSAVLVEAGLAVSFLPLMTVNESVALGDLCVVEVDDVIFRREIGLAWRRSRYFGPLIRKLVDLIVFSCNRKVIKQKREE